MHKCSIIVPVYNRHLLTRRCVDALLSQPARECESEIVVVDDASTDETAQLLSGYGEALRVITHETNLGFGVACNDGAAVATGDFLVFLNNDTIPQPGWLDALVRCAADHPEASVIGSKLLFPNDTVQHAGIVIGQDRLPRHIYAGFPVGHPAVNCTRRYQAVTAACALFRREVFEQAGGFDAAFHTGGEDVDLCLRLGEQGHQVYYCHESVLYHLESVSAGRHVFDNANLDLYSRRWADKVRPDDLDYYVQDGLLKVDYPQMSYSMFYPVHFSIAPDLGVLDDATREREADRLIAARARQVYDLLRENINLELRLAEQGSLELRRLPPAPVDTPGQDGADEAELSTLLLGAHEQVQQRDELLLQLRRRLSDCQQELELARAHAAAIEKTRVWRLGMVFWNLLARVKRKPGR